MMEVVEECSREREFQEMADSHGNLDNETDNDNDTMVEAAMSEDSGVSSVDTAGLGLVETVQKVVDAVTNGHHGHQDHGILQNLQMPTSPRSVTTASMSASGEYITQYSTIQCSTQFTIHHFLCPIFLMKHYDLPRQQQQQPIHRNANCYH